MAAYSALGISNRVYVLRADIDLSSLVGKTGRPTGAPADGDYWLDTTTSTWGIYEFNATTGTFANKLPIVITDAANISAKTPLASIGSIGDYAVNAIELTGALTSASEYFYKTPNNAWVPLGGEDWLASTPTVQGTAAPTSTSGTFTVSLGDYNVVPDVPQALITVAPTSSVANVATQINNLGWTALSAAEVDGKLNIYVNSLRRAFLTITVGTGTILADLGITAGIFFRPTTLFGTSAQMPLWQSGQSAPRPTGSVWLKVGAAGTGLNPVVSVYNTTTASWINKNVSLAQTDFYAISALDASGGKAIPAGSIYAQYVSCLLYTSPSPRDGLLSRMPSSA